MQSNPSLLVRAKAQSVFRACIEQMEMYKEMSAYRDTVTAYIKSVMGPWVTSFNESLGLDITKLSGDDYNGAVKLQYAIYKVMSASMQLTIDNRIVGPSFPICLTRPFGPIGPCYSLNSGLCLSPL